MAGADGQQLWARCCCLLALAAGRMLVITAYGVLLSLPGTARIAMRHGSLGVQPAAC
ncbi:hypothetical protein ACU686_44615 [Yinghuangia aomiensis]